MMAVAMPTGVLSAVTLWDLYSGAGGTGDLLATNVKIGTINEQHQLNVGELFLSVRVHDIPPEFFTKDQFGRSVHGTIDAQVNGLNGRTLVFSLTNDPTQQCHSLTRANSFDLDQTGLPLGIINQN
jgi:hypothetical protein